MTWARIPPNVCFSFSCLLLKEKLSCNKDIEKKNVFYWKATSLISRFVYGPETPPFIGLTMNGSLYWKERFISKRGSFLGWRTLPFQSVQVVRQQNGSWRWMGKRLHCGSLSSFHAPHSTSLVRSFDNRCLLFTVVVAFIVLPASSYFSLCQVALIHSPLRNSEKRAAVTYRSARRNL